MRTSSPAWTTSRTGGSAGEDPGGPTGSIVAVLDEDSVGSLVAPEGAWVGEGEVVDPGAADGAVGDACPGDPDDAEGDVDGLGAAGVGV